MNAIETHALTRRFGAHTAVDGLDLTVRQGELFALLGVNGAGKTTTLRMLSGLLQPTGGEADILGFRLTQQPQEIKRRINLSPQETAVAPNLTVRENLELIAGIYGASWREAAQRAAETIAEFHLGEVERSRAKTLSGGWQRRLSIAMALISQPQLVFLDEPTLGLDVLARRELWQVIRSLRGRVTVILTTHYLEEAEALSDRIGILSHGRLRICGTAQELCAAAGETRALRRPLSSWQGREPNEKNALFCLAQRARNSPRSDQRRLRRRVSHPAAPAAELPEPTYPAGGPHDAL